MAVSHRRWDSAADVGEWCVDFSDRASPSDLAPSRQNGEVLCLPLRTIGDLPTMVEMLAAEAELSAGSARQPVVQRSAKLAVAGSRPTAGA